MLDITAKIEITELIARYNRAIDTGDAEGWADTFLPDGVFDGIVGYFEGREQLTAFARAYWTEPQYEEYKPCQHWVTNVLVDGNDNEAELTADLLMVRPAEDGGRIVLVGRYNDQLERLDGRWLFARRRVRASDDPDAPAAEPAGVGHDTGKD